MKTKKEPKECHPGLNDYPEYMKFKTMTVLQLQKLRIEYSDRISAIAKEFKEETGLSIEKIYPNEHGRDDDFVIEIHRVI